MNAVDIKKEVKKVTHQLTADRRHLHKYPELSGEEKETAKYVVKRLKEMGIPCRKNVGGHGVVGLISGTEKGKCIALRADMDALPLQEKSGVSYASKNSGVMHACGHDAHTAILLATGAVLQKNRNAFKGKVKLLFQPSEEMHPGGAKPMIDNGVLENPKVDAALALHTAPYYPIGKIGVIDGLAMARSSKMNITIHGKGGHGAAPNGTVDPIITAGHVLTALQTVVSRKVDPRKIAVLSIGSIHGGQTHNIIPETVELKGTFRTFEPAVTRTVKKEIERILKGITSAAGASYTIDYLEGYPPLVNSKDINNLVREAVSDLYGRKSLIEIEEPSTGGEDFAYFAEKVPAALFRLGTGTEKKSIAHNPGYTIDEKALPYGVAVFTHAVFSYLTS